MFRLASVLFLPCILSTTVTPSRIPTGHYFSELDSPIRLHMKIDSRPTMTLGVTVDGHWKGGAFVDGGSTLYAIEAVPYYLDPATHVFELFPYGPHLNDVAQKFFHDIKIIYPDFEGPLAGLYDPEADSFTVAFGALTVTCSHRSFQPVNLSATSR